MDILTFFQQCINGLSLGSMYALIAIGYTMVYGCLRLINFAHADIMMVGAFLVFFAVNAFGIPFYVSAILAVILCGILGVLIDKIAYTPLRSAPRISMLITAIGVSFFLENVFNVFFGSTPRFFSAPEFFMQPIAIFGVSLTAITIIVPVVTLVLLVLLLRFLHYTKQGMAIRASAFDINTVRLMGINVNNIIALVFAIGSMLAGIGGIFYAISYPTIDPLMGVLIGLKAFAAAVLGGIGSVGGAVLGGFILGFTEVMAVALFPELGGYKDAFAFLFLILVLLFRPIGIMGDWRLEKSRF
ncbi:branched-chain amino acid ABC transporter permease [Helicobacter winghamensis]|uniref:Branched-chain amino acid ABC transporter permease n=1 Tax=Helicobacter winghamensis TaxID=157268 RepID=A0A2N3PH90_9HELI|nr:branched-chain amino acid ABC transporter permease [Helicobacter winghamensis]EEO26576.1 putative high-affinity branched-chain amino acid ABC transporter, permease protein LivH [Helicobacter winghamensis ATCC BAA-430]PKT75377.1 branched-chain amino acid ABC transporter permease [Helicobacter winghamensis]PKT75545.1 branched-chain amino acid ABC transporter permease [Helicobacter winghamensis]PKT79094.1 branched-chain amino acid ABC transporter permease [Helicobacter winghamensis]PKT79759.1 